MSIHAAEAKLIYFAERHPRFDAEAFRDRWRRHGRLGMSLPRWRNVARYAQYDPLAGVELSQRAECDGVATVVFRSEAARLAHAGDPDSALTRADEKETFARPVKTFAVLTAERPVLPHLGAGCRLFARLVRNRNVDRGSFVAWLEDEHAPRLAASLVAVDGETGYSLNMARPDSGAVGLGLDADCVEEISTGRMAEIVTLFEHEAATPRFRRHVTHFECLATREFLLHDG